MSNSRAICRPHAVIACCCRARARSISRVSIPNLKPRLSSPSVFSASFDSSEIPKIEPWVRLNHQRRTLVRAANWTDGNTPYETLGTYIYIYIIFVLLNVYREKLEDRRNGEDSNPTI